MLTNEQIMKTVQAIPALNTAEQEWLYFARKIEKETYRDTMQQCARLCEKARPEGGRAWDEQQEACYDALTHVAEHFWALETKAA